MRFGQVAANATTSLLLAVQGASTIRFKNEGPNTVFIGPAGVSITTGFQLLINEEVELDTRDDETLHAVCVTAETATVHYVVS